MVWTHLPHPPLLLVSRRKPSGRFGNCPSRREAKRVRLDGAAELSKNGQQPDYAAVSETKTDNHAQDRRECF